MSITQVLDPVSGPTETKPKMSRLPGAMGYFDDGFEKDESFDQPQTKTGLQGGTIIFNFAKDSLSATFELGKMILGTENYTGNSGTAKNAEGQQADQQASNEYFMIRKLQGDISRSVGQVEVGKQKNIMEAALRVSGGQMSSSDVAAATWQTVTMGKTLLETATRTVGISDVMFTWSRRVEQISEAKQNKENQELAKATRPASLLGRLDAQEGQSTVSSSGAIISAG